MTQLKVISSDGQLVTESREVAKMIGKEHKELMRSIRQYAGILTSADLRSSDYFIPSYYMDNKKEQRPCFLLTKKGCDMVANKMTGEKGVLFTAEYVARFEEMEQELKKPKVLSEKEQLMASLKLTIETSERQDQMDEKIHLLETKVEQQITLDYGEQRRLQKGVARRVYEFTEDKQEASRLFREIYREVKDRFGVASYKDVKRKDLQAAINYIENWIPRQVS